MIYKKRNAEENQADIKGITKIALLMNEKEAEPSKSWRNQLPRIEKYCNMGRMKTYIYMKVSNMLICEKDFDRILSRNAI